MKCKLQNPQSRVSGSNLFRENENKLNLTHNSDCFHYTAENDTEGRL